MKSNIKTAFNREMECARAAEKTGDIANAKRHLERAHILGQRWYISHMKTHFHMLLLALRQSDSKETRGQITRLIGAGPFHIAGWVPIGNTGGADVSATLPMPMPSDLQPYFEGHSLRKGLIIRGVLLAAVVATYMLFPK
jgi:Protein of unknown function (DUF3703)